MELDRITSGEDGYSDYQRSRKVALDLINPIPLHSWQEYHIAKMWIARIYAEYSIKARLFTKEEQQLAIRVKQWEDAHK